MVASSMELYGPFPGQKSVPMQSTSQHSSGDPGRYAGPVSASQFMMPEVSSSMASSLSDPYRAPPGTRNGPATVSSPVPQVTGCAPGRTPVGSLQGARRQALLMERAQLIADTSAALLSAHISRQPPPGIGSAAASPLASPFPPSSPIAAYFPALPATLTSSGEYGGSLSAPRMSDEDILTLPSASVGRGVTSHAMGQGPGTTSTEGPSRPAPMLAPSTAGIVAGASSGGRIAPPPAPRVMGGLRLALMQQQQQQQVAAGVDMGPEAAGLGLPIQGLPPISAPAPGAGFSIASFGAGPALAFGVPASVPPSIDFGIPEGVLVSHEDGQGLLAGESTSSEGRLLSQQGVQGGILAQGISGSAPVLGVPVSSLADPDVVRVEVQRLQIQDTLSDAAAVTVMPGQLTQPMGMAGELHHGMGMTTQQGLPALAVGHTTMQMAMEAPVSGVVLGIPVSQPTDIRTNPSHAISEAAPAEALGTPVIPQPAQVGSVGMAAGETGFVPAPESSMHPHMVDGSLPTAQGIAVHSTAPGILRAGQGESAVDDDLPMDVVSAVVATSNAEQAMGNPVVATSAGESLLDKAVPGAPSTPHAMATDDAVAAVSAVLRPSVTSTLNGDVEAAARGSTASPFSNMSLAGSAPNLEDASSFAFTQGTSSEVDANATPEDPPVSYLPGVISHGVRLSPGPKAPSRLGTSGATFTPYPSLAMDAEHERAFDGGREAFLQAGHDTFFQAQMARGMQPAASLAPGTASMLPAGSCLLQEGASIPGGSFPAHPPASAAPCGPGGAVLKGYALNNALHEAMPEASRAQSVSNRADFLAHAANAIAEAAQITEEPSQDIPDSFADLLPSESEVMNEIIEAAVDVESDSVPLSMDTSVDNASSRE